MPSARRRIAIIITTLIIAALPAMVPALIMFADPDRVSSMSAGVVALGSWIVVEALALLIITPIFTDMRVRFVRALRVSAAGITAGVIVTAPFAGMSLLSVGAVVGLIAGIWIAQRELGRALGAVEQSLRDDLRAAAAGALRLPGALRRLVGMLSGRHPISLRPPEPAPPAAPRITEAPVPAAQYRTAPAPPIDRAEDPPPPALPDVDDEPGRRRGDGI